MGSIRALGIFGKMKGGGVFSTRSAQFALLRGLGLQYFRDVFAPIDEEGDRADPIQATPVMPTPAALPCPLTQYAPMSEPVSAIRNLGPASVENFARAGLHTAQEVRALGADRAYAKLLETGQRPHFIMYYALVMGLQGRPWNDLSPQEKAALRLRFDAIVADSRRAPLSGIERELDALGVRVHPGR